ncbi:MAG TPA: zinc dependent phospholipase C family protein [Clostridia bacterium]|nr:zinc dependent phospholipase C family protein [Clostridia bacterium]
MPALLTHYLCGDSMLSLVGNEHEASQISGHRSVFNLGTQGPDIFFYYGAWPWVKSNGIAGFGSRMHEESTGAFICEALKYIMKSDEASKRILTAYMCGYLCHYVLDCHTHPYIFYKTGFVRKDEAYNAKYTYYHRSFETALDVLMLKREFDKKPSQFNASKQIKISAQAAAVIGGMYSEVLDIVYSADISSRQVCQAISDMSAINAALQDKTGLKRRLIGALESFLGKPPMFSSMILPLEIEDGLDYLNTSHSVWYLPWDDKTPMTSSFTECFDAAAIESKKTAAAILSCINGETDPASVLPSIGNRSFSTGCDCSLNLEFKYFDCIYE